MNSSPRGRSGWSTGSDSSSAMLLDRRRLELRARASDRLVRLRDDADDVEPFADQRAERRHRELGRAPEEHAHSELLVGMLVCRATDPSRVVE